MRRIVPAVAVTIPFLLAAALYASGHYEQYYALLTYWGAAPFRTPFLDMQGVTSAIQCHRLGFDVFVHNPCDVFQRVHAYSPLWLYLDVLPITTAWDNVLGIVSALFFVTALLALPPGRDWRQTMLITLATMSSATMFALERANVDLLMFALAVLAVALVRRNDWLRLSGYGVALLAGMLKFYPIVLLVLAVRERWAVCVCIVLTVIGAVAVWFAFDGTDILRGIGNIPDFQPFDDTMFGARNLPFGLAMLLGFSPAAMIVLQVAFTAAMLAPACGIAWHVRLDELSDVERTFLLIGCALLVGCFVLAQNVNYRAIYFLFVLPALTALGWRLVAWLIVVLMWSAALRLVVHAHPLVLCLWLARELAFWLVMTALLALLLRVVWESLSAPGGGEGGERWGTPTPPRSA